LPRPKSFNEKQVLEKIGHLFWREGYSSVSMDQVSSHASLTKTSIYNAYGDKASPNCLSIFVREWIKYQSCTKSFLQQSRGLGA